MFETSVIRAQVRTVDRWYGLLSVSIAAHTLVIATVIATTLVNTTFPQRAPRQISIPVFPSAPPALGTPDAGPKPAPRPAAPQTPRTAVHPTVVAPQTIPTVEPVPASGAPATDPTTTAGGPDPGTPGVPWGRRDGVGLDGPPEQTEPLPIIGEVKAPIVLRRVQPLYPAPAIKIRLNGFVIVECIIDRTGRIREARVVKSSSPMFEASALQAVQQWEFAPGTLRDKPVDTIFNLTVRFQISD